MGKNVFVVRDPLSKDEMQEANSGDESSKIN